MTPPGRMGERRKKKRDKKEKGKRQKRGYAPAKNPQPTGQGVPIAADTRGL